MNILVVGNLDKVYLRFLSTIKEHEIDWFNIAKEKKDRFAYGKTFNLIRQLLKGKYDLIISGKNQHLYWPDQNWLYAVSGHIWRFTRYPNCYGSHLAALMRGQSRLVVVNRRDHPMVEYCDHFLLKRCNLYFKREIPQNAANAFIYTRHDIKQRNEVHKIFGSHTKKLLPISLGIDYRPGEQLDCVDGAKTIDLFFAGKIQLVPTRKMGVSLLHELKKEGVRVEFSETRLSKETFLKKSASSYIVWSPEGSGWDCYRHYEAAVMGSVPLLNYPATLRYKPLEEGRHALYYGIEGDSLKTVVLNALQDKERLIEMGHKARRFVLKHHTYEALAQYVIQESLTNKS